MKRLKFLLAAGASALAITAAVPASATLYTSSDIFVVPVDGYYQIIASGAQGGNSSNYSGGLGGVAGGTVFLPKDTHVYIGIGLRGGNSTTGGAGGGGASAAVALGGMLYAFGAGGGGAGGLNNGGRAMASGFPYGSLYLGSGGAGRSGTGGGGGGGAWGGRGGDGYVGDGYTYGDGGSGGYSAFYGQDNLPATVFLAYGGSPSRFDRTYGVGDGFVSIEQVSVPEPASLGLFGLSLAGLALARRRRTA